LKGNAEFILLTPDLQDFPLRGEAMYAATIDLLEWIHGRLTQNDLSWLSSLPDLILWEDACLVHDSPIDRLLPRKWFIPGVNEKYKDLCHHYRGIYPYISGDELEDLLSLMESRDLRRSFSGHTHEPFIHHLGQVLLCNTGSVGMPLDGDYRPSWVLVEDDSVSLRRVDYGLNQIFRLIDAAPDYPDFRQPGMREAYKTGLANGRYRELNVS
jgi:diadenosine tetraphosphatase ApaH/serine/threonine PP2A family protein phosphatase